MKNISKAILLSVLVMALASCSAIAPQPTETPVPTHTQTSVPSATNTSEPTNTPTEMPTETPVPPTETPSALVLQMPSGKAASEWEGIPVMPDAIAGEGDSAGYAFTIDATAEEIQAFYEAALGDLGYTMFASGQGATEAIMLIFMKDLDTLSVSIIPQPDGIMYVLLVK